MDYSSPFDSAAALVVDQHQNQHRRKMKRASWSWFSSSSSKNASTNQTSPACFTGGLSVDYRDCEAPMQRQQRQTQEPWPLTPPLSPEKEQNPEDDDDDDARSRASSVMEIEFEWEDSSNHDEENGVSSSSLFHQAFKRDCKALDRDILREQLIRNNNKNSSQRRNTASGGSPPQNMFHNLLGSIAGDSECPPTELARGFSQASWDPSVFFGGYHTVMMERVGRFLCSPKRIAALVALCFVAVVMWLVWVDFFQSEEGIGSYFDTATNKSYNTHSSDNVLNSIQTSTTDFWNMLVGSTFDGSE